MKNVLGIILGAIIGGLIGFIIGNATTNEVVYCGCDDCGGCCPDFVEAPEKKPDTKKNEGVILDDVVEE